MKLVRMGMTKGEQNGMENIEIGERIELVKEGGNENGIHQR